MIPTSKLQQLPLVQALETVDQIAETPGRPKVVHLTGGEPLCHPDVAEIVKKISDHDMIPSIFTTGLKVDIVDGLKTKPFVDLELLQECVAAGLQEAVISVHSVNSEIQNEILGTKDCLNEQLEAMDFFLGENVKVKWNTVPMSLNRDGVEEVILMARELGVSEVRFLRFVAQGNAVNNPRLFVTMEQMRETAFWIKVI